MSLQNIIDLFLHLDKHLYAFTQANGNWVYALLFAVVFCETGLVIMPFLPGDSLLFVAGTLAGMGAIDVYLLSALLIIATIAGDNTNYWIGRLCGKKLIDLQKHSSRQYIKEEHLRQTELFFERHGGKSVMFARFFPMIRTFAPFVAGIGRMHYPRFLLFSVLGALSWVGSFVLAGYFFGNIPAVKDNLMYLVFGIVLLSLVPVFLQVLRRGMRKAET